MRRSLVVLLSVALASASTAEIAIPDTKSWSAQQWRAAAEGDVRAAYDHYRANHPGIHDKANPGFIAQLERARDAALALARQASSAAGYADALGAFSVALADHHATLGMRQSGSAPLEFEWPGFIPAWRDGTLHVHSADAGSGVVRGERIVSCDGLEPGDLARRNLATSSSYPLTSGEYWTIGGAPFNSTAATAARRARLCQVRAADGSVRAVTLQWRRAPADFVARRALARTGERTEIGLSEPRPGLFLIGMPTFSPTDSEIARYDALFAALAAKRAALVGARAVVIDLRHNQGGSSSWSQQAGRILWGDPVVDAWAEQSRSTSVWWRASEGNAAYVGTWPALFRKQGRPARDILWAEKASKGMRSALAAKQPFWVEKDEPDDTPAKSPPAPAKLFATPVYVITHGQCGSACLDAVDLFKAFPNVRLIGAPTASDTNYMDVRVETLPSGLGQVVIPQKVYVGRKRASGAYYTPDILMPGLDWSTAAFLDRIEADLAQRPASASR